MFLGSCIFITYKMRSVFGEPQGSICGFRSQRPAFLGENPSVSTVGPRICERALFASAPPYPAERKSVREANRSKLATDRPRTADPIALESAVCASSGKRLAAAATLGSRQ